jgi:branched-chain amino acid transport system permease protein
MSQSLHVMESHTQGKLSERILGPLQSAAGIMILATVALLVAATIDKGPYIIVNTIVTGGMWALMSMGLALVFGVMNIPHFAIGEVFMTGGLVAFFVATPLFEYLGKHPNPFLSGIAPLGAIFAAAFCGYLVGVLSEWIVFRPLRKRSREQWIMNTFLLTLGISVIMINGHQLVFGTEFKGIVNYWNYPSLSFLGVYISFDRVFVFTFAVIVMAAFWAFMKFARMGQAIRAVSQDETGALMVGIHLNKIHALTMGLSCGLAALAGACLLFMFPSYPTVGIGPLYNAWFVVIVVGLGNVAGTVVGGFIVALFQILTTVYVGEGYGFVIPSLLIIIILIFKPSGIFGSPVRGILDR